MPQILPNIGNIIGALFMLDSLVEGVTIDDDDEEQDEEEDVSNNDDEVGRGTVVFSLLSWIVVVAVAPSFPPPIIANLNPAFYGNCITDLLFWF